MPVTRDLKNRGAGSVHLAAATISSDTTTSPSGTDTIDSSSTTFFIHSGAWTDGTYTPNIQDSDDDVTYADVGAWQIIGAETAIGAANTVVSIGVNSQKKYVRCQIVSTGTTSGAVIGILAVNQTS